MYRISQIFLHEIYVNKELLYTITGSFLKTLTNYRLAVSDMKGHFFSSSAVKRPCYYFGRKNKPESKRQHKGEGKHNSRFVLIMEQCAKYHQNRPRTRHTRHKGSGHNYGRKESGQRKVKKIIKLKNWKK